MKKIVAILTMMILAAHVFGAGARTGKPRDLITVERTVGKFNKIKVSGPVELIVVTGKEQKVAITCDSKNLHTVETTVNNGELNIAVTGVIKLKNISESYKVEVWVEDLKSLTASGLSNVIFPEKTTVENFSITSSGVSKTTFDDLVASGRLSVEINGASHLDIKGQADRAIFEGTGACNLSFTGKANSISLELSGAGKTTISAETERLDIEASGACKVTLSGNTKALSLEASGATSVKSEKFKAENRQVSFSGAAKITIVD
ncbi:MAG: DUF2807 domain-containing protein [Bacteroidales bacterium]|nr:DUF2807 domain-containing protein [Bacteroidales bacterium]MBP5503513.1 DUF2807 domain-containing protein [Bacteroidales bacterium]